MRIHFFSQARTAAMAALISVAALLGSPLSAQTLSDDSAEQEPDRWYQVEVILLAHKQSTNDEIWRTDIALAYPPNWVELKDPEKFLAEPVPCPPELDAAAEPEQPPSNPDDIASPNSCHAPLATDESTVDESTGGEPQPAPLLADLDREPYYLLPKELRALNDQAQELKWSRQHRVLFHQAWRQPIVDKSEATSIIIAAGEQFGDNAELEGTISINVSRYLHLNTNLWFSEFSHNYGQDKGQWPELPTRPDLQDFSSIQIEDDAISPWDKIQPLNDEYDKILAKPYIPQRITLIKQKRRMRSKEIHYIDHPKVGLVILIEPYEVPAVIDDETIEVDIDTNEASEANPVPETETEAL